MEELIDFISEKLNVRFNFVKPYYEYYSEQIG